MNIEKPILTETEQTRTAIKDALHKGVCRVVFTKTNGEERIMLCTLREDFLPEREYDRFIAVSTSHKPKRPVNVLSVWDIEVQDWRAFKVETVKEWNEIETEPMSP